MRFLPDVLAQILPLIPEDYDELRGELYAILQSASCAAPEMQLHWWKETASTLFAYIPEPLPGWQQQVKAIFNQEN